MPGNQTTSNSLHPINIVSKPKPCCKRRTSSSAKYELAHLHGHPMHEHLLRCPGGRASISYTACICLSGGRPHPRNYYKENLRLLPPSHTHASRAAVTHQNVKFAKKNHPHHAIAVRISSFQRKLIKTRQRFKLATCIIHQNCINYGINFMDWIKVCPIATENYSAPSIIARAWAASKR
jgi:hypothetical protein